MKQKTTLRNMMWGYFAVFALVIFVMLWVFQIMLFTTYYETMKEREIGQIGLSIARSFENANLEDYDAAITFRDETEKNYLAAGKKAFEQGVSLNIFDGNGNMLASEGERFHGGRFLNPKELETVREKILSGEVNKTFKLKDGNFRTNIIASVTSSNLGGNEIYFYIKAPLMPVDATIKVLRSQLLMVTIVSLIIALIAAYFASNAISKPIKKITKSAKILATGNYDVHFDAAKYYEICELADTLNYAADELSKTDTLRRDLMANVSHDLKTPLTIIKSYAEMIRDLSGENYEKRNLHTQIIIDETDRLTSLVSDMLDLSSLEAGTVVMKNEVFDLSSVASTLIDNFKILEENEGYQFEMELENDCYVEADKKRISQVIYNLVNNAINYTGDDKKIIVKVKNEDKKVRFEVSDTGEGIDEKSLDKVWDRYYKSSKTHKRTTKGTGIGLSIVKNVLTEHGAKFGVISEDGNGSTFWFELLRKEK